MQYQKGEIRCQLKCQSSVYERSIAKLFPELCPRCRGTSDGGFCAGCRTDFIAISAPCLRCGLPRPVASCPAEHVSWQLDKVVAPFSYCEPLDRHIHALKFSNARQLGRAFGLLLAEAARPYRKEVDALVAVPLHRRRWRERGYNQALEIAAAAAGELELSLLAKGIGRCRETLAQSTLTVSRRSENLRESFEINRDLSGYRLGIVDDVITTASTVNALALALRSAGADSVQAWAPARTLDAASAQLRNV